MANFDEKSGIVPCKTEWGSWWQTMEEVYLEVNPDTTLSLTAKAVKCDIRPRHLTIIVNGATVIDVIPLSYF